MALAPLHEKRQIKAIEITLATAPKIQEDLIEKFGIEDNSLVGNCNLFHYRMNNSLLEIAEDLASDYNQTVEERYGLINDRQAETSVGSAFRGHHNEEFMPEHQFDGLFRKELNKYIKLIRAPEYGRIGGRKGYANGLANLTPKEYSEHGWNGSRKSAEAQGNFLWTEKEGSRKPQLDTLDRIVGESIGKGRFKRLASWDSVTTEFNEETGLDLNKNTLQQAHYKHNLNRNADEEE